MAEDARPAGKSIAHRPAIVEVPANCWLSEANAGLHQ